MTARVFTTLFFLVILWGSAFPLIKVSLSGFSAPSLTLARFFIASLCFVPVLALSGRRLLPERRDVPFFAFLGFLGITVYHLALNVGQEHVTAGAASLLIATAPAITSVLAFFFLRDRLPLFGWLGILISFGGVSLIVVGEGAEVGLNPYALLITLAAVVISFATVLQKPLFSRYHALEVTAFVTWAGTLPLFLFLPRLAQELPLAGTLPLLATVYIAVFPAALANALFAYAISKAPITLVTPYLYAVPVFSLFFSWFLLSEVPTALTLTGGMVALAGIVVVNTAKRYAAIGTARLGSS